MGGWRWCQVVSQQMTLRLAAANAPNEPAGLRRTILDYVLLNHTVFYWWIHVYIIMFMENKIAWLLTYFIAVYS